MRNCKTLNETSIIGGELYFEDVPQASIDTDEFVEMIEDRHVKTIRLVSLPETWREWFWNGSDYTQIEINLEMTLRAEIRSKQKYWYGYRKVGGKLQKRFVGKSENVTTEQLVKVAQRML